MFRKYILCLALATAAFNANACQITFTSSSDSVMRLVKDGEWTFKNYDKICEKLKRAHAKLRIQGQATVLSNQSISWVNVGVVDMNMDISTDEYGGSNTVSNTSASMDIAEGNIVVAFNNAVEITDFDKALQSLEDARRKVRAVYKK